MATWIYERSWNNRYDIGFKISYREALGIQSTPFHSFYGSRKSIRQSAQRDTLDGDGGIHGTS